MIRQNDGRPRGRVDSQKAGPGAVRMAPAVGVGHKAGRARRAGHLLQFVQVAAQCLVPLRDAQASVLKGLLAHRGQGQLAGRGEQNPFHTAAAMPASSRSRMATRSMSGIQKLSALPDRSFRTKLRMSLRTMFL